MFCIYKHIVCVFLFVFHFPILTKPIWILCLSMVNEDVYLFYLFTAGTTKHTRRPNGNQQQSSLTARGLNKRLHVENVGLIEID